MRASSAIMSLRRLLAALVALALFWGPVALQNGAAMASAPADHGAQMMANGHCDEAVAGDSSGEPQRDKAGHAPGKACCTAMCMAIEVPPLAAIEPMALFGTPPLPALRSDGTGVLVDLPTPPPRRG